MNDDLLFDGQQIVISGVNPVADTPERALLRAILEDAIEIAVGLAPVKDGRERLEARRWLESKSDNWVLPCSLACFFLGIDQGAMLKKVGPKFKSTRLKVAQAFSSRRRSPVGDLKRTRRGSKSRSLSAG